MMHYLTQGITLSVYFTNRDLKCLKKKQGGGRGGGRARKRPLFMKFLLSLLHVKAQISPVV